MSSKVLRILETTMVHSVINVTVNGGNLMEAMANSISKVLKSISKII